MDLKAEIQQILSPPHNHFTIIQRFEELGRSNRKALLAEADSWLLQLYDIDPHFFNNFLIMHRPPNAELCKAIYLRAEKDANEHLFRIYYAEAPNDEINREVTEWIKQELSVEQIQQRMRIRYRYPNNFRLSEASCIALYKYNRKFWEETFYSDMSYHNANFGFEEGSFEKFRALVKQNISAKAKNSLNLHLILLKRFGTESEKQAEARRIIERAPTWENAYQELHILGTYPIESELELIKKRFMNGSEKSRKLLFTFLMESSKTFAREHIESEIASANNENQLETVITDLRNRAWNRFYEMTDIWILKVYELAPTLCMSLIQGVYGEQLKMSGKVAAELLKKVQQRNHREMLRFVNLHLYNHEGWNAALLDLTQSNLSQREFSNALSDLDCQPRYVYHNKKRAWLKDEVAAAIYRASSNSLFSFILHNLAPNTAYPLLLDAAAGSPDYYVIFREVADAELWQKAMQALLQRDFPADEIVSELERLQLKRRTTSGSHRDVSMDASVLKGFVDKYGEAVLPFFERYVSWVTEGRLKALLALDIDRAELLRELNVIARREPEAFSRLSKIWALPLYERGANFFESFLIRYLGTGNEYTSRQLLERAKADRQLNLFRALYRLVVRGAEWEREMNRFIDSKPNAAELTAFLELYDIAHWEYTLHDVCAAAYYITNPELSFPFIMRHISRQNRWGMSDNYNSLLKATEANPEHHLAVLKVMSYEKYWRKQIDALLKSDITGEEALVHLQNLHPTNTWEIREKGILRQVFKKFASPVAPYMVENINWIGADDEAMELIEKYAPSSLFWQAVFMTIGWNTHKSWSHKRWQAAITAVLEDNLTDSQVRASLEMLSPPQESRWQRYSISDKTALSLYQKYPSAARAFIQAYYPNNAFSYDFFAEAQRQNDEEMLDFLSYIAMSLTNTLIHQAFPRNPQYQRPDKKAETNIKEMGAAVIERFEALYQRDPNLYVRHAALTLAWWRPLTIWNAEAMVEHNPIYHHIITQHLEAWMASAEALREVLESPNIFVQLMALKIITAEENPQLAERILENKRIFRQLLLGRARLSTKRFALSAIEKAIAANPASAAELLPIMEEAADFYGRLAISDHMMISITRIKYALEEGGQYVS